MTRNRRRLAVLATATALGLSACSSTSQPGLVDLSVRAEGALHGTDISDVVARPGLALRDTTGAAFDLRARPAGQVTVLFFGYTHCPDVCPTTMADLAAARRALSAADRSRVEVAFVTEDPVRDTAPVLRRWLDRFDPTFLGLLGGGTRTAAVLTQLKSPATTVPATTAPGEDSVEHGGSVYVFSGSTVVVYTGGTSPEEYAEDLHALVRAGGRPRPELTQQGTGG